MALQWAILVYVVAAEAAITIILTLPWSRLLKLRVLALASLLLQPAAGIVVFAAFQLLDLYWKKEHRLMCVGEVCTVAERARYERSVNSFIIIFFFHSLYIDNLILYEVVLICLVPTHCELSGALTGCHGKFVMANILD
ncbi:hypothetical protein AXF42_Ash006801 [Apostasia shenzhenica]|uniref:Endoplasmic reticulum transmembrane protein n=1 Tax=Apostasia shenzhenica TaxID=1088818 RepID=A0A2I0AJ69_9ASPA|nr:hypothetical protein AXF42_Ash006801 [Apostasia shenzhenica]